jgi:hypothetical protein
MKNFSNLRNRRPNNMGAQLNGNPVGQVPLILSAEEKAAQRDHFETEAASALMENAVNYRNTVMSKILGGASLPYADDESELADLISKAKHSAELACVAMGFVPSVDIFRDVEKQLAKRHSKMVELLKLADAESSDKSTVESAPGFADPRD